ncbi:MAG: phosphatidate cytidylyltransferase [Chloroflexi bacterium]|nr:phosphatidate cytidylyltransferase [Chloroflexota bacterium]
MGQRVRSALILVPFVVLVIWVGEPLFSLVAVAIALFGLVEFYQLAAQSGRQPLIVTGGVWTLLLVLSPHWQDHRVAPFIISLALLTSFVGLMFRPLEEKAAAEWAWTVVGILYLGWLVGYLVALRGVVNGREWTIFTLFTVFASDTSAFLVGRTWGRHPLVPHISPKKTIEGVIGGVVGALVAAFLLGSILGLPIGSGGALLLGGLSSLFGQWGDLCESMLKRSAGVKDAGQLIPGHGGILDRLDSVVFAVVVVYYYVIWVV